MKQTKADRKKQISFEKLKIGKLVLLQDSDNLFDPSRKCLMNTMGIITQRFKKKNQIQIFSQYDAQYYTVYTWQIKEIKS